MKINSKYVQGMAALALLASMNACKPKDAGSVVSGDAAAKVYVAPGKYDEYYNFVSGGFPDKFQFTDFQAADYFV